MSLQEMENRLLIYLGYVVGAFVTFLAIRGILWLFGVGFVERLV